MNEKKWEDLYQCYLRDYVRCVHRVTHKQGAVEYLVRCKKCLELLLTILFFSLTHSYTQLIEAALDAIILVIIIIGWSTLGSYLLTKIFHMFKASQRLTFYIYLMLPPLAILMLIIFVIIAKRYKLRERERHVNIQAIVRRTRLLVIRMTHQHLLCSRQRNS